MSIRCLNKTSHGKLRGKETESSDRNFHDSGPPNPSIVFLNSNKTHRPTDFGALKLQKVWLWLDLYDDIAKKRKDSFLVSVSSSQTIKKFYKFDFEEVVLSWIDGRKFLKKVMTPLKRERGLGGGGRRKILDFCSDLQHVIIASKIIMVIPGAARFSFLFKYALGEKKRNGKEL